MANSTLNDAHIQHEPTGFVMGAVMVSAYRMAALENEKQISFENVILLVNSPSVMEQGWAEDTPTSSP